MPSRRCLLTLTFLLPALAHAQGVPRFDAYGAGGTSVDIGLDVAMDAEGNVYAGAASTAPPPSAPSPSPPTSRPTASS
jgi:hypothetical protein